MSCVGHHDSLPWQTQRSFTPRSTCDSPTIEGPFPRDETEINTMKPTTLVALALICAPLMSCNKEKAAVESNKEATKDAIDQRKEQVDLAAKQAKEQAEANAKIEKARIEANKEATQAQLDAQKKKADADAAAEKARIDAENR